MGSSFSSMDYTYPTYLIKPWRTRNRCRYRKIAAQMKSSFMVETLVQVVSVVYDCS
jgi:hypothetical protein